MIAGKKDRHPLCIYQNKEHNECRVNGLLAIKLGYLCNQSKKEIHKKLQQHKLALAKERLEILITQEVYSRSGKLKRSRMA